MFGSLPVEILAQVITHIFYSTCCDLLKYKYDWIMGLYKDPPGDHTPQKLEAATGGGAGCVMRFAYTELQNIYKCYMNTNKNFRRAMEYAWKGGLREHVKGTFHDLLHKMIEFAKPDPSRLSEVRHFCNRQMYIGCSYTVEWSDWNWGFHRIMKIKGTIDGPMRDIIYLCGKGDYPNLNINQTRWVSTVTLDDLIKKVGDLDLNTLLVDLVPGSGEAKRYENFRRKIQFVIDTTSANAEPLTYEFWPIIRPQ